MFAEAMQLSLMEEYQAWNYMAADNTKQIGGYLKKFDRLSWITVKGAFPYQILETKILSFRFHQTDIEPLIRSRTHGPNRQANPSLHHVLQLPQRKNIILITSNKILEKDILIF